MSFVILIVCHMSKSYVICQSYNTSFSSPRRSVYNFFHAKKLPYCFFERFPSRSLNVFHFGLKDFVFHEFPNVRINENSFFQLRLWQPWKLTWQYYMYHLSASLSQTASWCQVWCEVGLVEAGVHSLGPPKIGSASFFPTSSVLLGHTFWVQCWALARLSHSQRKHW